MDGGTKKDRTKPVPVGQVIFGQFIDHDITLDVMSQFGRVNDPEDITNQRTPTLDLDCIYGAGPESHPFLYHNNGPFVGAKLLTGVDEPGGGERIVSGIAGYTDAELVGLDFLFLGEGREGQVGAVRRCPADQRIAEHVGRNLLDDARPLYGEAVRCQSPFQIPRRLRA